MYKSPTGKSAVLVQLASWVGRLTNVPVQLGATGGGKILKAVTDQQLRNPCVQSIMGATERRQGLCAGLTL